VADDFSELYQLSADLRGAGENVARFVDKAVKFTSVEIKKDWAQGAERSGLGNYSKSIDFDMKYGPGLIESEIGPNLAKRQGNFGFVEDGGGDVRSAPQHAGRDALEANEPDFRHGLEVAGFDALMEAVKK